MLSPIVKSENSEIWTQSAKYNGSCDWLDNARICETSCENNLLKCLDDCQTDGCTDQCKSDFYIGCPRSSVNKIHSARYWGNILGKKPTFGISRPNLTNIQ